MRNNRCLFDLFGQASVSVEAIRTFNRKQLTNKAPAAFLTFPKSPDALTRSDIVKFCMSTFPELEGGIVAKEKHKDGSTHYHAAVFGSFTRKNAFPKFNKAVQEFRTTEENALLAGTGCHMQFTHERGTKWPFHGAPKPDMVDYLTVPTDKKPTIDKHPRCFIINDIDGERKRVWCDVPSLRDAYSAFDPGSKAGLLGRMEMVVAMAQSGAKRADVIAEIAGDMTKDNSYQYQILMDVFRATDKYIPEAVYPDFVPKDWQKLIIDRIMLPIDPKDNNHRGIWLCTPAGGGKSTLLRMIEHHAGLENVFTPTLKNNTYSAESMNGYEQQPIIIIDDVRAFTSSNQEVLHKGAFIQFMKSIASGDRMSYQLYGKRHDFLVQSRILITSNFGKPVVDSEEEQKAIDRRYIEINTNDVHMIAGLLKLPRKLGYRAGLLVPEMAGVAAAARAGELSTPRGSMTRPYSPPDSDNPAPRARVRFNNDTFVLGTDDEVDTLTAGVEAMARLGGARCACGTP